MTEELRGSFTFSGCKLTWGSVDMKAIVVEEPGGPEQLVLRDVPMPKPRPGHLVARVEAAGVNPVDAGNRADPSWAKIAPPYVLGYEFAGSVELVGDDVEGVEPGDLVWAALPVRGTRHGAYAEFVEINADLVGLRPASLDATEAAAIPLAGSTALHVLDRLALEPGQSLLIHGAAGGVGSLLVQLACACGIRVAGSASGRRHRLLRQLGVEWPVDYEQEDASLAAVEQRGGRFDAVADLVGQGSRSLVAIRDGGALASIVELRGDFDDAVDRNITLHGILLSPSRENLDRLADAVIDDRLRPVIDTVVTLNDAVRAHRRIETGHGQGKVILQVARHPEPPPRR